MKKTLMILALVLAGCSTSVAIIGNTYPAIDKKYVKVLINETPNCNYEQIGHIQTPLMYNQNKALDEARVNAAKIGADYISADIYINNFNDASVSAIAYKCNK